MAKILDLALRTWQFICTLIIMSLIGNMIEEASAGNPSSINFTMFLSSFAMLSFFFYFPAIFMDSSFVISATKAALDALNVVFWLCAAITIAAKLTVHSCKNHHYLIHNEITNGEPNMTKRCREAQASDAFLWFGWAAFTVSLILSAFELIRSSKPAGGAMGSRGPAMRQV